MQFAPHHNCLEVRSGFQTQVQGWSVSEQGALQAGTWMSRMGGAEIKPHFCLGHSAFPATQLRRDTFF